MIGVIIQARSRSSRLPRKIYKDLNGKYLLQRSLESATRNKVPHHIILAMPESDKEEFLERQSKGEFANYTDRRFSVFFGDEENLVKRYYDAANKFCLNTIVRLTADCAFSGLLVDEMLLEYLNNGCHGFMGNNLTVSPSPYPCGLDVEIFSYAMLCETYLYSKDQYELEHLTPYMYSKNKPYKIYPFLNCRPHTMYSTKIGDFSVDTETDYQLMLELTKYYDECKDLNKAILKVDIDKYPIDMTLSIRQSPQ